MRRLSVAAWGCLLLFGLTCSLVAQEASSGMLRLCFQDVLTGKAVVPESVLVDGNENRRNVDRTGKLSVMLPNGNHDIDVTAKGFRRLNSTAYVDGANTLVSVLELEPLNVPDATTSESEANLARISGHVVDDDTGAAIADAEVRATGLNLLTKTDADGAFNLEISSTASPGGSGKTTVVFSKTGYQSEERRNVPYAAGAKRQYSIRLERLEPSAKTNTKVIDEQPQPTRLSSWVFDFTSN